MLGIFDTCLVTIIGIFVSNLIKVCRYFAAICFSQFLILIRVFAAHNLLCCKRRYASHTQRRLLNCHISRYLVSFNRLNRPHSSLNTFWRGHVRILASCRRISSDIQWLWTSQSFVIMSLVAACIFAYNICVRRSCFALRILFNFTYLY